MSTSMPCFGLMWHVSDEQGLQKGGLTGTAGPPLGMPLDQGVKCYWGGKDCQGRVSNCLLYLDNLFHLNNILHLDPRAYPGGVLRCPWAPPFASLAHPKHVTLSRNTAWRSTWQSGEYPYFDKVWPPIWKILATPLPWSYMRT